MYIFLFHLLFFPFYINCILARLYTTTPKATAMTTQQCQRLQRWPQFQQQQLPMAMTTTTIIPSYLLPSYQLLYILFFFFSFAFYINCILVGLYTTTQNTTATPMISTMTMTTYSNDYDDYYPWLFTPLVSIIIHCFFHLFFHPILIVY